VSTVTRVRETLPPRAWRLLVRSRPRFWLYTAGPVVVAAAHGAAGVEELFSPLSVALFAYFLLPANVYLYGINDVFDADIDEENPKKGEREAQYHGDPLEAVAVLACGAGLTPALVLVPTAAVPWFGGFLILATAYSAPPVRFKTKPLLDSVSNGLYILPGVGTYVALTGTAPPTPVIVGAWLWTMAMHTFSAIPDIEPDREAGIRTTATLLGGGPTLAYCGVVWAAAAAAFWPVDPRATAVLAVYPLLVVGIHAADVDVARAYWYYPAVNTVAGMLFTLAGLWVMVHG
jgi:4-hydroxybenzoate polyprenyltransferase